VTRTRRLVVEGVAAMAESELRARISERVAVDAAWVDSAPLTEAIAALYVERGYLAARAVADFVTFEGDAAELRVRVVEGARTVLKDVVTTGVAPERAAAVSAAIAVEPGQLWLPGTERDATRRLERFYLDGGYRAASVQSRSATGPDGRVTLAFTVVEGPLSVVNAVAVTGLDATKPGVADKAITLRPGAPAGQREAAETQRRLYGLGLFRSAEVSFEPATAAGPLGGAAGAQGVATPVNVTVALQESRRYQFRYGVQVSNQYGPVLEDFMSAVGLAGDIRDRNFLGRGFTLGAATRLEKNLQSLRWQFSLPTMLDQRLQTNVFATIRSESDTSDADISYVDKQRDVTFEQRWRARRQIELSWGYSYNVRDVGLAATRVDNAVPLVGGALASINGTFILDTRDKPFDASRGWFQSSNVQWGLRSIGSDYNYLRMLLRQFYYRPAGPVVLAGGVRWGQMWGFSGTPPITVVDQFFDAGGAQTVRGYQEDSLSAIEINGAPVGGTKVLLLNQEVRFPIVWLLKGAAFIDAGNTFAPGSAIALNGLAVGVGAGIRIMTPFAPIRIDVGFPLDRRPGDRGYRVHVSIGQIF
jgi:outer membrane protein insertion porin family